MSGVRPDLGPLVDGVVHRRAARVLLVDGEDRVLLLRGTDPADRSRGEWWFTPGGGLDEGEQPLDAARRELAEETGLQLPPEAFGPVVHARVTEFTFAGVRCRQDEVYFLARVDRHEVDHAGFTPLEVESVLGSRWWPRAELAATGDTVYPAELPAVLARALVP